MLTAAAVHFTGTCIQIRPADPQCYTQLCVAPCRFSINVQKTLIPE